jgi:Tetracyclin repressor-like, C-terminal domain
MALVARVGRAILDAPLELAVRSIVESMIAAHRVDFALHKVLFEQLPRVGRLEHLYAMERANLELAKTYFTAHAGQLEVGDPDLCAFVVVHTIESLTHAAVLMQPELLADDALVAEITKIVVRYLTPTPAFRAAVGRA